MLLNIDKPTKQAIFHPLGAECAHVPDPLGTEHELIGRMGRDGGWFEAATLADARATTSREAPVLEAQSCHYCGG
ncbi:hypothetical protein DFR29_12093 [Tahibacter aquaticus]|jgi:hypothetical protein|uniref:Uncharacterized protein n=1 Tax=Tahibacter aquaticus TaxID=520092 RepID=A0A4V3DLA4_9GAMM|nr:hypothetical protein [Tahibacter aquaticus]TDR38592.1 hypothetical protein DFR29_12093 [Tahibacter aquaticus]